VAKLQIAMLGGFHVSSEDGRPVDIRGDKKRALLAYLVLHRETTLRREKLSGLLWPDSTEEQARHSLRQAVLALKREIEEAGASPILVADGPDITLEAPNLTVDVEAFERLAVLDGRTELEEAASLYRGDLLEGLRSRSELFDDWLAGERARLSDLACSVLERLAARLSEAGDFDAAIETGRKLLAIDPLQEAAHRSLMWAYYMTGRRMAALQQYKSCEEVLQRELNISPDAETTRLFAEIRGLGPEQAAPVQPAADEVPGEPIAKKEAVHPPRVRKGPLSGTQGELWAERAPAQSLPAALSRRKDRRTGPRGLSDFSDRRILTGLALLLVAGAALILWEPWRSRTDGPVGTRPSIAVLPLRNLSGDPEQDYFGDAVTEGIITALSRISRMFVVASSSTLAYRGRAINPQEVAQRLGVQYILEGSFQREAGKVRVTARLTNAEGTVLWSERYDRVASDIFAVQDEITLRIITGLQIKLTEGEQERLSLVHGTTNLKAWEYAGQALLLLRRLKREDNARARKLYELAITLDPNYPGAYDGLAWTHVLDARFGWSASAQASVAQAVKYAEKAYALDPSRPRTYALIGHLQLFKGDVKKAIAFGERSVELSPSGAENYALLAITYSYAGQPERAIKLVKGKAMKLSPLYPGYFLWVLGRSYRLIGEHERAIGIFSEHLKREPDALVSAVELVTTYGEMGRRPEASRAVRRVLEIEPGFSLKVWARTLIYQDRTIAARELQALRQAGLPD
jgi:TolB-like protein/DNA-binding SARP family transcriptional activator